jgi:hypothetical protein
MSSLLELIISMNTDGLLKIQEDLRRPAKTRAGQHWPTEATRATDGEVSCFLIKFITLLLSTYTDGPLGIQEGPRMPTKTHKGHRWLMKTCLNAKCSPSSHYDTQRAQQSPSRAIEAQP